MGENEPLRLTEAEWRNVEELRRDWHRFCDADPEAIVDPELVKVVVGLLEARDERAAEIASDVRKRLEAGRKRPLSQIDEHVASIADNIAAAIRGKA